MTTSESPIKPDNRRSFSDDLATLWPGIPYLGLGVWFSWVFVAFSGTFWLSDVETAGGPLSLMHMTSFSACALVLLAAPGLPKKLRCLLTTNASVLCAGFIVMLGSLLIILAGPYYLHKPPLFYVGGILAGIGIAAFTLKCGELLGSVQPWRALIYALLSQLIVVIIFFFVLGNLRFHPIPGGPSLGGILALMFLPLIAALLLSIKPPRSSLQTDAQSTSPYAQSVKALSSVFWKFLTAIFVFTLTTSIVRGVYTNTNAPSTLLSGATSQILVRALFFVALLLLTIRFFKFINFGKPYLFFMGLIAVIVALSPLLQGYIPRLAIVISFSLSIFDITIWCLLAFIVFEKRISPIIVFGFGRGVFMTGSTLGWIIGTQLMPRIIDSNLEHGAYIAMAILILVSITLVFSEKDFASLFAAISEIELDLEGISIESAGDLPRQVRAATPSGSTVGAGAANGMDDASRERPYLTACTNVGKRARLSKREQHILELLALGRGSENIAKRLSISLNTVRTHTHNIYAKLGVHSRQELIELIEQNRNAIT
ncbi:MAG: LuxR C-terminal-related transcriptional regulator [Coriobacteriia bacterium]|nr:LuxR C-terminal-related transcriptional regulator [Coriobacteriia bacterium]